MSPYTWLWSEIERLLSPEEFARLRESFLAQVRAKYRTAYHSDLAPDAPKTKGGRHKLDRNVLKDL